jgi:hypothetical protein
LSGLFDFFQSASNTVADNVAGPVDLINAGLGLFGLRSKEPVGGSEWMKRWGLKRDVEMGPARIGGETFGLLSPAVLAAKAPQIAKGLLQAQENAAIPRQFNPEMGAIVYHGSPHKFDKFDSSKIGTGEGAQAYGHGMYFAESPGVAKTYQDANVFRAFDIAPEAEKLGLKLSAGARGELIRQANANAGDPMRAAQYLQYANESTRSTPKEKLAELIDGYQKAQTGNLYKVDLPDTAIAKMLDWDKPLSQQAPEVQKALKEQAARLASAPVSSRSFLAEPGALFKAERDAIDDGSITGGALYRLLHGLQITAGKAQPAAMKEAEMVEAIRKQGIPGIRYLDGGSRGAGSGTSNYVVFPGEEHLLKILERNGGLMGP